MLPNEMVVSPGCFRDAQGMGALVNTRELTVLVVPQAGDGAGSRLARGSGHS
jgi:hypothetical protein